MPDGADVAGTSHHDFNADGGDYGADYGVHDAAGDYTGTDVGFTGTLSADQLDNLQGNLSSFSKFGKYLNPINNADDYIISSISSVSKNAIELIKKKRRNNEPVTGKDLLNLSFKTARDFIALYSIDQVSDMIYDSKIHNFNDQQFIRKHRLTNAIESASEKDTGAYNMFLKILNHRKDEVFNETNCFEREKTMTKLVANGLYTVIGSLVSK